jgi:hypothetical protein
LKKDFEGFASNIDSRRAPYAQARFENFASMIRLLRSRGMPGTFSTASVKTCCYRITALAVALPPAADIISRLRRNSDRVPLVIRQAYGAAATPATHCRAPNRRQARSGFDPAVLLRRMDTGAARIEGKSQFWIDAIAISAISQF